MSYDVLVRPQSLGRDLNVKASSNMTFTTEKESEYVPPATNDIVGNSATKTFRGTGNGHSPEKSGIQAIAASPLSNCQDAQSACVACSSASCQK